MMMMKTTTLNQQEAVEEEEAKECKREEEDEHIKNAYFFPQIEQLQNEEEGRNAFEVKVVISHSVDT